MIHFNSITEQVLPKNGAIPEEFEKNIILTIQNYCFS